MADFYFDWIQSMVLKRRSQVDAFQGSSSDLNSWESEHEVPKAKQELRQYLLKAMNPSAGPNLLGVKVEGYALAHYLRGLDLLSPTRVLEMDKAATSSVQEINAFFRPFSDFCDNVYSLQRWEEFLEKQKQGKKWDFFYVLSKSDDKWFARRIEQNQREKVVLLSEDQRVKYRSAFVDIYENLPSRRVDKMPEVLGLAMADPVVLINSVEQYGKKKTAAAVAEWTQTMYDNRDNQALKKDAIWYGMMAALGAAAAFAPRTGLTARGIVGATAAVSGWLAFQRLLEYYRREKGMTFANTNPLCRTLNKFMPDGKPVFELTRR